MAYLSNRSSLGAVVAGVVGFVVPACLADEPGHTKPPLVAPAYVAGLPGKVAAQTAAGHDASAATDSVLRLFDLSGGPPYPAGYLTTPTQRYSDALWSRQTLGTVFGLTIDRFGHMYVGHTTSLTGNGFVQNGTVALPIALPNTAGTIYRINGISGIPTKLVNLPQIAGGSGIGNLDYDNQFNQFFATNFTDDRVYRISQAGSILSTFKHSTGVVTLGGAPDPTAVTKFAPVGRRLWAVGKLNDRVYYSIWNNDFSSATGNPNTVWSVGIGPGGDFIPYSQRLEVSVPLYSTAPATSAPIADVSFSADCRMLIAERSMYGNGYTGAHNARSLEYMMTSSGWSLSPANTNGFGPTFGLPVGNYTNRNNAAGGCDYDFEVPFPVASRRGIFVTADAQLLSPPYGLAVYGFEGIDRASAPPGGNGNTCFDFDAVMSTGDKSQQGDVEISSPTPCARFVAETIKCNSETTPANYLYSLQLVNTSAGTITGATLNVLSGTLTPATITLGTPVPPGGTINLPNIVLSGVTPPGPVCIVVTLTGAGGTTACSITRCVSLPPCDCLSIERLTTSCVGGSPTGSLLIRNRRTLPLTSVLLIPLSPGVSFVPSTFVQPSVPFFGLSTPMPFTITGAVPGQQVCFRIRCLAQDTACETVACLVVPNCGILYPCIPCTSTLRVSHRVFPSLMSDGRTLLNLVGFAGPPELGVASLLVEGSFSIGAGPAQPFSQTVDLSPGAPTAFSLTLSPLDGVSPQTEIACNYTINEIDAQGNPVGQREAATGGKLTKADAGIYSADTGQHHLLCPISGLSGTTPLLLRARDQTFSGLVTIRMIPSAGITFPGAEPDGSLKLSCLFSNGRAQAELPITFDRLVTGDAFPIIVALGGGPDTDPTPIGELLAVQVGTPCRADVTGGGPSGLEPDGTVDGADFVAFINSFAISEVSIDPIADIAGGGSDGLEPDGTIDGADFVAFINGFALGC